jgi:hypothetical protein
MTDKELKIEKAMRAADGNLKHEGMYLTDKENELVKKCLMEEITDKEFIKLAYEEAMK